MAVREVEIGEALAGEATVRHDDAPEVELGAVSGRWRSLRSPTSPAELSHRGLRASTTTASHGRGAARRWRPDHALVLDAAEPDARNRARNSPRRRPTELVVTCTVQLTIRSAARRWRRRFEIRRQRSRRPRSSVTITSIDDDGRRVAQRVGDHRVAVDSGFGRSLERRRVRGAPAKQTGTGRPPTGRARWQRARRASEGGDESARGDDGLGTASAQTGEERRTRRQPDGVGEQDEAELAEQPKPAGAAQRSSTRADGQAREEGGSRTERHTLDANRAADRTERYNQEDEQDRVVSENIESPSGTLRRERNADRRPPTEAVAARRARGHRGARPPRRATPATSRGAWRPLHGRNYDEGEVRGSSER